MSQILVSPDELRGYASQVKGHAASTQEGFQSLQSTLSALQDVFQGQAAVRFDEVYNEWHTSAQALMQALDGLGQFLDGSANTIEAVDSELAAGLG
jgi:WXG100 family type VII secretion target